jgi:signal peptidase I
MKLTRRTATSIILIVAFFVALAFALSTYTRWVGSGSMVPSLEVGDLVVIQPVSSYSGVHVGDIIVYDPPCSNVGSPIVHRVVNQTNGGFITQGDDRATNPATDQRSGIANGPVTLSCIEGRAVFIVPYIELVSSLPTGWNYAVAVALLLVVILLEFYPRGRAGEETEPPP